MDGIAVFSRETVGASEQHPVTLKERRLLNTGNVVPPGYDAVIMIEDTWQNGDQYTIRKTAAPWQHIRPAGEELLILSLALPLGLPVSVSLNNLKFSPRTVSPGSMSFQSGWGWSRPGANWCPQAPAPPRARLSSSTRSWQRRCSKMPGPGAPGTPLSKMTRSRSAMRLKRRRQRTILSLSRQVHLPVPGDFTADVIAELARCWSMGSRSSRRKPGNNWPYSSETGAFGLPGNPPAALTVIREIIMPFL